MGTLKQIIKEIVHEVIKEMKKDYFYEEIPQPEMDPMLASNVSTATWRENEEELIQVTGYGMVSEENIKNRLLQMFNESISNLQQGKYTHLNKDFGVNSIGSLFITSLNNFYKKKSNEQDSNIQ